MPDPEREVHKCTPQCFWGAVFLWEGWAAAATMVFITLGKDTLGVGPTELHGKWYLHSPEREKLGAFVKENGCTLDYNVK